MTSARPLIVRLLGGSGAVIVFLIGLIASLGAALGAPLGLFLVRRRARRRNRHASRIASFVGAVASATVVGVVIWGVFGSLMPRPPQRSSIGRRSCRRGTRRPFLRRRAPIR